MPDERIAIDDIVSSVSEGVLRALEARSISGQEFTRQNGFFVKFDITAGGPFNPELLRGGGLQRGIAEPGG
jgi:hypothetical protein